MMRRVYWVLGALLLLGGVAGGVVILYLLSSLPNYEGEWVVEGLHEPVEVWRDSLGIPHIWASNEEDLYFTIGYLHAQDRLWQMELFRRVAEGRLSEIFGERFLDTDRFLRTLGLGRAARDGTGELDVARRSSLEAYASGVNAWLSGRRGALPPEFVILRHSPEPWAIEHSLMLEKIMAWDLTTYQRELDLARALSRLGAERVEYLIPGRPDRSLEIIEVAELAAMAQIPPDPPEEAVALLDALSITRASNSWVISGEHTTSGKPILANDMHLALNAPSLWYLAALHGGALDVVGMTLPGAPFVVAGHNHAIAWGLTNAYLDDADLFIERLDPSDPGRYLTPEGSRPFKVIEDTIHMKGRREPVIHRTRLTRNGPVMSDAIALDQIAESGGGDLISLRWMGDAPSRTWKALAELNAASGWDEFIAAVEIFDNPHQNLVYADTAGRIGYKMGGRVPLRGAERVPPQFPVPGWTDQWDWVGVLPFSDHPELVDPPEGFIVTANNRQVAGAVGDLISNWWDESFRAERIRDLLEVGGPFDAGMVQRQQLDLHDTRAARYRGIASSAAEEAGIVDAAELLDGWDLEAGADSRGAALYYTWLERLRLHLAGSLYGGGDDILRGGWFPRDALTSILELRAVPWVEGDGTREFDALALRALREADSIAGGKSLGEIQIVLAEHAMGDIPVIGKLLRLNVGPAPIGGSATTVNVASGGGDEIRVISHGASQRQVTDMGDIDGAGGFIIPTGQSGNPLSRHYRDQFERWREGKLWQIPLDRERARARSVYEMRLNPGIAGEDGFDS